MSTYDTVMQELDRRTAALVQKHAGRLSEHEALRQVFKADPSLYHAYRDASAHQPRPEVQTRSLPQPTGAEAALLRQASQVAKSAGLNEAEAFSRVCAQDPDLYQRYRRQASGDQPTAKVDQPPAPVVKARPQPTPAVSDVIPQSLQVIIEKTATVLSPGDRGKGLQAIEAALTELRAAWLRR